MIIDNKKENDLIKRKRIFNNQLIEFDQKLNRYHLHKETQRKTILRYKLKLFHFHDMTAQKIICMHNMHT